jgi:hypothetical protein
MNKKIRERRNGPLKELSADNFKKIWKMKQLEREKKEKEKRAAKKVKKQKKKEQ